MKRSLLGLTLVAIAMAIALAAVIVVPPMLERNRAERAVSQYNAALIDALREVDHKAVSKYAHENEMYRLENYFVQFNGRGVYMEAELLDIDFGDVASQGETVTVETHERWRYVERNRKTGQRLSDPVEEEQSLQYILAPLGDSLAVFESRLLEEEAGDDGR